MANKHIVTIGGGTGTFVVLSGLKRIPQIDLSAVVTVADSGGSTGRLRDAYGFLPVGDARQALVALAGDNGMSIIRDLFLHRFSKGDVAGHNFGNLFLTALTEVLGTDVEAIEAASKILKIRGKVLPVSETAPTLVAHLENGESLVGEHEIDAVVVGRSRVKELTTKEPVRAYTRAIEAITDADLIILGPGDLYASTVANLVVDGIPEAIQASKGKLIYVVNLFSKSGQTEGYTASKCVEEITRYAGRKPDYIIVNSGDIPQEALEYYASESECPIEDDLENSPAVIRADVVSTTMFDGDESDVLTRSLIRHDSQKLATLIETLL